MAFRKLIFNNYIAQDHITWNVDRFCFEMSWIFIKKLSELLSVLLYSIL